MIPQRNLSLLSNRLADPGGLRIPETILERDYCLSWFLAGLSRTPLRDQLAFKGGTALKKCYFGNYRFSEDLAYEGLLPPGPETNLATCTTSGSLRRMRTCFFRIFSNHSCESWSSGD